MIRSTKKEETIIPTTQWTRGTRLLPLFNFSIQYFYLKGKGLSYMVLDEIESTRRAYYFLKSYKSLHTLAERKNEHGAFKDKAVELVTEIEAYRDNLDEVKREIFANLFTKKPKETKKLCDLYKVLCVDKIEYKCLKTEILLDFAKSYREGALLVYKT
ncbi:hypothetical protein HMPREF9393_1664 [Streptococcus sanguinis SK1056]|uniref:Uncharacterized protein n=2 Tax=Streptococcus sanguinis TaxID=1305 RepID=F3UDQ7_STRSA|nr:hypothetical protein HMPREF9393_1664 [Streptococcus sanguinis SK1056]